MECFILLTLVVTAIVHHLDSRRYEELRASAKGLPAVLNQDIYNRIGPGETTAYRDFFAKYEQRIPSSIQLTELLADREGLLQGFPAVDEAPEPVKDIFRNLNALQDDLANLLKKGPFILSKNESGFDSAEYGHYPSIQADVRSVMLWIRMVAMQKWLQGSRDEAIRLLANIFYLGNSFRRSPDSQEWIFEEMCTNGFAGMNLITWNDPSPGNNRLIAQCLEEIHEDDWTPKGQRIPQLRYYLEHISRTEFRYNDELVAVLNILSSVYDKSRTEMTDMFLKAGMIPSGNVSYGRMGSLARKWTTEPAMRKRAERIPDSFFETDPLLSAETIKKFPRLIYLSYRYDDERFYIQRDFSDAARRNRAKALKAAYAARIWRDEHGAWPTPEQFAALTPQSASLVLYVTSEPRLLIRQFMRIHGIDEYFLPDEWNRSYCIGYIDVPKLDYLQGLATGYGYSYGVSGDLQFSRYDWIDTDESKYQALSERSRDLLAAREQEIHQKIEGASVTASVLLPNPPKKLPAVLSARHRWRSTPDIKEVRTLPECDAVVVCPIPRPEIKNKPWWAAAHQIAPREEISPTPTSIPTTLEAVPPMMFTPTPTPNPDISSDVIYSTTAPHQALMNWASGIFKAFTPLVVSVTEVCPPPQMPDYESLNNGAFALTMYNRVAVKGAITAHDWHKTMENIQHWPDPAQGQPAVVVGLKFPRRSFWVTHPGPDGVSDGPGLVYDPSNGIKSAGDIVQLAGMEY